MSNNGRSHIVISLGGTGIWALAFVILKLVGVIKWSWLWVLAPIWIPFVIGCLIIVIGAIIRSNDFHRWQR